METGLENESQQDWYQTIRTRYKYTNIILHNGTQKNNYWNVTKEYKSMTGFKRILDLKLPEKCGLFHYIGVSIALLDRTRDE